MLNVSVNQGCLYVRNQLTKLTTSQSFTSGQKPSIAVAEICMC